MADKKEPLLSSDTEEITSFTREPDFAHVGVHRVTVTGPNGEIVASNEVTPTVSENPNVRQ